MSWREELQRREVATAERAEALRLQIAGLTEQLNVCEKQLSRLLITRETMNEILSETDGLEGPQVAVGGVADSRSMVGAVLVPQHLAGMDASVLPGDYIDIMAVLADAEEGTELPAAHYSTC